MPKHEAASNSISSSATTSNNLSNSGTKSSSSKGLARIGPIKKIVHSFISRAQLEISSLHISSPDETGLCAKGKIRLSHLVSGPIPLVGLKVKFKEPDCVLLYHLSSSSSSDSRDNAIFQKTALAKVHLDALTLQPGVPGSVSSDVNIKLIVDADKHSNFVNFVKDVVRADPKSGMKVSLSAQGVQVKVYGMKFGGLKLEKEVSLGGLGCLGGALIFENANYNLEQSKKSSLGEPQVVKKPSKWSLNKGNLEKVSTQANSSKTAVNIRSPIRSSKQLEIHNLEIVGGDASKGIKVTADVSLENPSKSPALTVEPGELRFILCVPDRFETSSETKTASSKYPGLIELGSLSLAPMILSPGSNQVKATGYILLPSLPSDSQDVTSFQYRSYISGQESIAKILQNETLYACAVASRYDSKDANSGASTVGWLAEAFEGTRIDAKIPPLGNKVRLLDGAELRVEGNKSGPSSPILQTIPKRAMSPNDFKESVARATLRNSFGADIHIEDLKVLACSSALYDDKGNAEILELGKVYAPKAPWSGVTLKKGGEPSPISLPMEINPDPKVLIEILLKSAKSRKVDLGNPLTSLLEELRASYWSEAGWSKPPHSRAPSSVGTSRATSIDQSSIAPDPSDDLAYLLSSALANLIVSAHIEAKASIGDYNIPGRLKYVQRNLPIALSTTTAASLLPLVGQPFIKAMVDRADVEVSAIRVKKMDDRGVLASVAIRMVNFGPLSASVRFVTGLELTDIVNSEKRTVAVLLCDEEIPIIAGTESPVDAEARIIMPSGSDAQVLYSHFISKLLCYDSAKFGVFTKRLSATSGGVHFETSLDKAIILEGLGGFPDLKLENFEILGEAEAPVDGVSMGVAAPAQGGRPSAIQFRGKTTLRNAGDLSIGLQRLELGLQVNGINIGQASIESVEIKSRGASRVDVNGLIYAPIKEGEQRSAALESLSGLIEGLLGGKTVNIEIQGQRAWVKADGGRSVSLAWLDNALREFKTTASVLWKGGVPVVDAVNVGCIEAVFPSRGNIKIRVEEVTADYSVPFPINVAIASISADLDIMFEDKVMGSCSAIQDELEHVKQPTTTSSKASSPKVLSSPITSNRSNSIGSSSSTSSSSAKVGSKSASGTIKLSLQAFDLNTTDDNKELGPMISHAVQAGPDGTTQISLRGTAKVQIATILGDLNIRVQLGKDHLIKVAGLDGLRTSPFQYTSLEVISANPKFILAKLDLFLNNPSNSIRVSVPDSSLNLAAYFQDAYLGDVILGGDGKGINLNSGPIRLFGVEFRYRPASSSEPMIRPMLTQFLSGKTSTLNIRGHSKSSTNAALAQALSILSFDVDVRPIDQDILHRISVQLGMGVITSNTIDAQYTMKNPINLDIDILHLEVFASHRGKPFGTANKSYNKESKNNRMLLPAGNHHIANDLVIKLASPLDKLVWAFLDERGSIVLNVEIKAILDINGFIIPNFMYTQSVPLDVSGLQGVAKLLKLV